MKPVGERSAGNPHAAFDERGRETESRQAGLRRRRESAALSHRKSTTTAPVLDSTESSIIFGLSRQLCVTGAVVRCARRSADLVSVFRRLELLDGFDAARVPPRSGPTVAKRLASSRNIASSGQAVDNERRTQAAPSTTRVAILIRRRRDVLNLCALGGVLGRCGGAQSMERPVGGGMQDKAELVRRGIAARGAVGGEPGPVQLLASPRPQ